MGAVAQSLLSQTHDRLTTLYSDSHATSLDSTKSAQQFSGQKRETHRETVKFRNLIGLFGSRTALQVRRQMDEALTSFIERYVLLNNHE